ncbi:Peptidase M16 inactive domain protein [compost metagenome]
MRKDWYAPNNMTLIVVGDLDKLLPAYLERAYGALEAITPGEHPPLPQIQASATHERTLTHSLVGNGAKLHWLVPEPVLEDGHDETFDLLKDYLDWALYRQLRLAHGLSYGPWAEREVFGGVGFMSLNADLERDAVADAEQVLEDLKAGLLKDGLNADTFNRLKQAAIARQAWAVQGNSALADYYWSAIGNYEDGHFTNPARELQGVTLEEANKAVRELLLQPGYLRIEKPLFSYDQLMWLVVGGVGLIVLMLVGWRLHRRK